MTSKVYDVFHYKVLHFVVECTLWCTEKVDSGTGKFGYGFTDSVY